MHSYINRFAAVHNVLSGVQAPSSCSNRQLWTQHIGIREWRERMLLLGVVLSRFAAMVLLTVLLQALLVLLTELQLSC